MRRLAWLGLALVGLTALGAATYAPDQVGFLPFGRKLVYVLAIIASGLVYAAAVAIVRNARIPGGLALALAVAFVLRAITFATPPLLSTDLFRYVWDGRVQAAGINPYLYVPAAPELAFLRDGAVYPNINRAETAPTIYPPAGEALFALIGMTWSSVRGVKAAMLGFDLIAIGVALGLLRTARQRLELVLIYAWNPLPVWEFGGGGHIDAAATALAGLALLACAWRRPGWAGAALAAATLTKLLPAALFPAIWRRGDWRTPLICGAAVAAGYAAYAGAGWRVLGYLPGYADEEGVGGAGAYLIRLVAAFSPVPHWVNALYAALALAALLALAGWIALRAKLPTDPAARAATVCRDAVWLTAATMVAVSPHYPWYFAGLVLPSVLAPSWSVLWLTIASPVLYLDDWHDKVIWPSIVFLPFAVLLAFERRGIGSAPALAAKGG